MHTDGTDIERRRMSTPPSETSNIKSEVVKVRSSRGIYTTEAETSTDNENHKTIAGELAITS